MASEELTSSDVHSAPSGRPLDPPIDTKKQNLPFAALLWEDFERLVNRLVELDPEVRPYRYGRQGQAQDGIDILARTDSGEIICYQCKKVKTRFSASHVKNVVDKFIDGKLYGEASHLVLCVTDSLQDRVNVINELKVQAARLAERNTKLSVWDASDAGRLSSLMKQHPKLVLDFFGEAWARVFNSPDPAETRSIQQLDELHSAWIACEGGALLVPTGDASVLASRQADLRRKVPAPRAEACSLVWIPPGLTSLPDGTLREVPRPVLMMSEAVSCAMAGIESCNGADPRATMATHMSMHAADADASKRNATSGMTWRLPSVAEWWMAMTAGTGRASNAGTSTGGLLMSDVRANVWGVRPPPTRAMEWAIDDTGVAGVVGFRGEWRVMQPHLQGEWIGYRLVLDYFGGIRQ